MAAFKAPGSNAVYLGFQAAHLCVLWKLWQAQLHVRGLKGLPAKRNMTKVGQWYQNCLFEG